MGKRKKLVENFRGSENTAYAKLGSTCDFTLGDFGCDIQVGSGSLGEMLAKDMGLLSDDKLTDATQNEPMEENTHMTYIYIYNLYNYMRL